MARHVVFASARGTPPNLYRQASVGGGGDALLLKSTSNNQPTDWSSDGRFIVFAGLDPTTQWDLWLMPMSGGDSNREPVPLLQTEFNEHLGRVSPDGRWIAYASDESGSNELYVRPFRSDGPTRRISANGGSEPKWRGDGKELFYLAADGSVVAVEVLAGPGLDIGPTLPLFKIRMGPTRNFGFDVNYSVTRDGQRFVSRALAEESDSKSTTTVILNWRANPSTELSGLEANADADKQSDLVRARSAILRVFDEHPPIVHLTDESECPSHCHVYAAARLEHDIRRGVADSRIGNARQLRRLAPRRQALEETE